MKSKTLRELEPYVAARWGGEEAARVMEAARLRWEALCRENAVDSKNVKLHREKDIFPCISLYEALQARGVARDEALAFLDKTWSERAESEAEQIRSLLRIPGLYRLYPAIFGFMARKLFGTAAGFSASFYACGRGRCKFDMTRCLFLDTCRQYGCPELTVCFCHTDDVKNGSLHPRLRWNRTQYMGGGGEKCDFDISVER